MRCAVCDFLPPNVEMLLEGDLCFKCLCIIQEAIEDEFPEIMERDYACGDVTEDGLVLSKYVDY